MYLTCVRDEQGVIGIAEILCDFGFVDIEFTVIFNTVAVFVLKITEDPVVVEVYESGAGYIVNAEAYPTQSETADVLNLIDVVKEIVGD